MNVSQPQLRGQYKRNSRSCNFNGAGNTRQQELRRREAERQTEFEEKKELLGQMKVKPGAG
jgi:hypothetical protein